MVDEGEPDIILNNDKKILSIDQNNIDNNNNQMVARERIIL